MKPLGTIEEELVGCNGAWEAHPGVKEAYGFHHGVVAELLPELWERRVAFIMSHKDASERAARLRNFRPVITPLPEEYLAARAKRDADCSALNAACAAWAAWDADRAAWDAARAKWNADRAKWNAACAAWKPVIEAAFNKDWPDNTWNGEDIFGKEVS